MGFRAKFEGQEYNLPDKLKGKSKDELRSFIREQTGEQEPSRIPEEHIPATAGEYEYTTRPTETMGEGFKTSFAGHLLKGLEVADRPRAAIAGGITAAVEGRDISEAMYKGITGQEHRLMGDLLFKGLDKVRTSYEEAKRKDPDKFRRMALTSPLAYIFDKAPMETTAAVATIGGIALDIGVDPITYTGVGLTKQGKHLQIFDSLQKAGIDATDPKMAAYIKTLTDKGKKFEPTVAGQFTEGQRRLWVAGVPIPGKVIGKTLSMAGTVAEKIKATKLVDDAWSMFSTKHGLKKDTVGFADVEERFKNVVAMARYHSVQDNVVVAKRMKEIADKTGIPIAEINRTVTDAIERGGIGNIRTAGMLPEHLKVLQESPVIASTIRELSIKNRYQLMKEQNLGVRINEMGAANRDMLTRMEESLTYAKREGANKAINPVTGRPKKIADLEKDRFKLNKIVTEDEQLQYFKHAITPHAKKLLVKKGEGVHRGVGGGKVFSTQHASTLARRWRGKTIDEINTLAKRGKLDGYEGIKFKDGFFHTDPALVQTLRDINHRKAVAVVDLIDQTKGKFGVDLEELRGIYGAHRSAEDLLEMASLGGYRQANNTKLKALTKGYAFPEEIAARLDTHYDAFANTEVTNAFLNGFDATQKWWKAYTLGIFPAYHFRNGVGNLWNNFVTGTKDFSVYGTAQNIQRGKSGSIKTVDGRTISYDQIRDHLDELGVHNRGFIATDIEQAISTELGNAKWMSLGTEAKAIQVGRTVGSAIENNARIGKFIDELSKGKSTFDAAQEVKRVLFDYQDLTKFEKSVAKRLMPFYTWSRKNIPLQATEMVKHPGRYKAVDTIRMEVENNTEVPDDPNEYVLHDWMLDAYPTRIRMKPIVQEDGSAKNAPEYFVMGGWLPAADIWKLVSKPQQLFVDMLSPLIKAPMEFATDRSFFTWNELDKDINVDFLGIRISEPARRALSNLRLLTTADNLAKNLGVYEKTAPLMPSPERDMTVEETWLSFLTGIKTYAVDLEKSKQFLLQKQGKIEKTIARKLRRQEFKGAKEGDLKRIIDKVIERDLKLEELEFKSVTKKGR